MLEAAEISEAEGEQRAERNPAIFLAMGRIRREYKGKYHLPEHICSRCHIFFDGDNCTDCGLPKEEICGSCMYGVHKPKEVEQGV